MTYQGIEASKGRGRSLVYWLPQESVGVLIRARRPCAGEITEVHLGIGGESERDVTRDLGSLVLREGLGKARGELCDCAPHGVFDLFGDASADDLRTWSNKAPE